MDQKEQAFIIAALDIKAEAMKKEAEEAKRKTRR